MIRPWYRSRLFWLGMIGGLMLLGVWLGYSKRSVDLCLGTRSAEYCIGWGGWGQMAFVINKRQSYTGLEGSPELGYYSYVERVADDDQPQLIAPALHLDKDRFGIFVANWLVVLIYLVLWLSGLAYWQRRKRRLSNLYS